MSRTDDLIIQHMPLVRMIASQLRREHKFVRNIGDLNDVVQVAHVGLVIAARQYDERSGPFSSYAEAVIRREIMTAAKQDVLIEFNSEGPPPPSLKADMYWVVDKAKLDTESLETKDLVEKVLMTLTGRERTAIELRHGDEKMSVGEIGKRLRLSRQRVHQILRESEEKIRKSLQDRGIDEWDVIK